MITNNNELEKILEENGIQKRSETDSEIIPLLVEHFMNKEGLSTHKALEKVWGMMDGSNAIVLINKNEPNRIYTVKQGSPLFVGVLEDGYICASETSAFSNYTQEFVKLEDDRVTVLDTAHGKAIEEGKKLHQASPEKVLTKAPPPYKSYFEWEINQQPEALMRALNYGARISFNNQVKLGGLDRNLRKLKQIENLLIAACGTSYYAGLYGAEIMRRLGVFNSVQVQIGSEIREHSFPMMNAGLLSITQSGETEDLKNAIRIAQDQGITCFNVINRVESSIAQMTQSGVFLNAGREYSVASTKAFVA